MPMNWAQYPLLPPKLVAIAQDTALKSPRSGGPPLTTFTDSVNMPHSVVTRYGQDITFATGRTAPNGADVGTNVGELKIRMRKLLGIFASGDTTGMATRLVDAFLKQQTVVTYFEEAALNAAAAKHPNITHFCNAALSAPNNPKRVAGKTRIHGALKNAGWDITKLIFPNDLGVPAFNNGDKFFSTGDFNNGLGLMINGVQYVYVLATHYYHDKVKKLYCIGLKYFFYDVFGLDDEDLVEYGAKTPYGTPGQCGITAWWQLQHQHGFAPLVTRIVVHRGFEAPAT